MLKDLVLLIVNLYEKWRGSINRIKVRFENKSNGEPLTRLR